MTLQLVKPGSPIAEGRPEPMAREFLRWLRDGLIDKIPERLKPTAVNTGNYAAQPWDLVLCDITLGGLTVTLPARCISGTEIAVKNASAGVIGITINPAAGDTIDGAASASIVTAWACLTLCYDAATRGWYIT